MDVAYHPGLPAAPLERPKLTYVQLIKEVIETSATQQLSLKEIYEHVVIRYPYYLTITPSWKNVIRHCLSITPAFQNMPRQSHQRGKGGLWVVDYTKPDVYSRKRGKRGVSTKTSPKSGTIPLLPHGLVAMAPEQDLADEASGSGSGWSSNEDYAGLRYQSGLVSNWSLSPQMPLEANASAYYVSTTGHGSHNPQSYDSAYQPMSIYPLAASSSSSSRSSLASPTTNEFPPRFAFTVPSGLPTQSIPESETEQHLMPAWSQTPTSSMPSHQPPAYEPTPHQPLQTAFTYTSPSAGHRPSDANDQWTPPSQEQDIGIIGATGWSVSPLPTTEPPRQQRHVRGMSFKEAHPVRPTAPRQLSLSAISHIRPGPYDYPLQQVKPPSLATLRSLSASQIPTLSGSGYMSPSGQSARAQSPVAAPLPSPSTFQAVSPALQINGVDGYFDIPRHHIATASTPGSETAPRSPYELSPQTPFEASFREVTHPPPVGTMGQLTPPVTENRRIHGHGHRPYASLGSTTAAISAFRLNEYDFKPPHVTHTSNGHLTDGSDDTEQPVSRSRFGSLANDQHAAIPAYVPEGADLGVPRTTLLPPALVLTTPPWYPA